MRGGTTSYAAFFLAGTLSAIRFPAHPVPLLAAIPILLCISYYTRKRAHLFLIATHLAIFLTGAASGTMAIQSRTLPPSPIREITSQYTEAFQKKSADFLRTIIPDSNRHATLCALTIGSRQYMTREMKHSFSAAGAMHVLALSGLHIGIAFAIIYRILGLLVLLPYGKVARNVAALAFIGGYMILSGCSPSVVRAATMIFIYRIAKGCFRQVGKTETIALAALISCTISPLQITSIGFQLSYSAVIGIFMLFPVCIDAYKQLSTGKRWAGGMAGKALEWLWNTISLSVCCQIATLPLSLYHFGSSAPYFLITNLIAVPTATAILYSFTAAMLLQPVPVLGEAALYILKMLLSFLNSSTSFIAG